MSDNNNSSKNNSYMQSNRRRSHILQGAARFNITREIADTLQGRIYGAVDFVTGRVCVVKEAWKQLVHKRISRKAHKVPENFLHERKMLMNLSSMSDAHPGLVHGIEQWEDEHCYYVAMEFCNAELFDYISHTHSTGELLHWVQQQQALPQQCMAQETKWLQTVKYMFLQIVQCVSWMHSKGFCHLDLSLENTMISSVETKTVKIIDLGLAQEFDINSNFQYQGRVGKLQYMCPEAYDRKQFDARAADVYCLGVMLFMMLIGAPPYPAPQRQNAAFRLCMNGRIRALLKHWKRLRLVTEDALDLLSRIFRYEKDRITISDILLHPFFASLNAKQKNVEVANMSTSTLMNSSHSQFYMENQMSTDSAIMANSSSMSIGDSAILTDIGDEDDGMHGSVERDQGIGQQIMPNVKQKSDVYLDHYSHDPYVQQQQAFMNSNTNINMCNAQHYPYKESCAHEPVIQMQYDMQYGKQVPQLQQQQQRRNVQSVQTHCLQSVQSMQSSRPQSEQPQDRPQNPYFEGTIDQFHRPFNNALKSNPEILEENDSKYSDDGRAQPLYSRLLNEWNLMKYNENMFNGGHSDVSQWHLLNVRLLRDELMFEEKDANYFMLQFGSWNESNHQHFTPSTSEMTLDMVGDLIKNFTQ